MDKGHALKFKNLIILKSIWKGNFIYKHGYFYKKALIYTARIPHSA